MAFDPYNLDGTQFAEEVADLAQNPDPTRDEPSHPLLQDPDVAALVKQFQNMDEKLAERNNGANDAYLKFEPGMVIRLEVLARLELDFMHSRHPRRDLHHPYPNHSL